MESILAARAVSNSSEPPPYPDEFIGQTALPCAVITVAIATIFVALRFYTRAFLLRRIELEDWFILLSLTFAFGAMGGTIAMLEGGMGRHKYYVRHLLAKWGAGNWLTNFFYSVSLTFTKISILCLYIRILTYDYLKFTGKILLGIVLVSHAWIIADLLTACVPLRAFWDVALRPQAYCHGKDVFWSNYGLHVGTDFLIFSLPLPILFRLKAPRRQKIGLYVIFLLAFIVCAISVVRMVLFVSDNRHRGGSDITWVSVRMTNWSMIEICASIVCACLTTLKPLLVVFFPSFSSTATGTKSLEFRDSVVMDVYQRPLTIGTRPTRDLRALRDSWASSEYTDDAKYSPMPDDDEIAFPIYSNAEDADPWRPLHETDRYSVDLEHGGDATIAGLGIPPRAYIPTERQFRRPDRRVTPWAQ